MICELNGLAGCGKTTRVKNILEQLAIDSNRITLCCVDNFGGCSNHKLVRLLRKCRMFIATMHPTCLRIAAYLVTKVAFSIFNKNNTEPVKELIVKIAYICYLIRAYKKDKNGLVITDEGIVQSIAAFDVCSGTKTDMALFLKKCCLKEKETILFVSIICGEEFSKERITIRNRVGKADIDSFTDEELKSFIERINVRLIETREVIEKYGYQNLVVDVLEDNSRIVDFISASII